MVAHLARAKSIVSAAVSDMETEPLAPSPFGRWTYGILRPLEERNVAARMFTLSHVVAAGMSTSVNHASS